MTSRPNTDRSEVPVVAVEPSVPWLVDAVRAGGGLVGSVEQASGLVWTDARDPDGLDALLGRAPHLQWVQLPFAGVENFVPLLDRTRSWTCGKGVYAEPVAEMALTLGLAGLRGLWTYARAEQWSAPIGHNLLDGSVVILGGGGITTSLVRLLQPWRCRITVVRRTPLDMPGVHRVVGWDQRNAVLADADLVVLALALTPETVGCIGRDQFAIMRDHAWVVNVARGGHIITEDLVAALQRGEIGGAALDVTDPEPLPADHPLWTLRNCLITPHVGNTPEMAVPLLAARVRDNVRRFATGQDLIGPIDVDLGY